MKIATFTKAALVGVALACSPIAEFTQADNLRVVRTGTSSTLAVSMNRAVVVESDTPFAELSIANPSIADISSLSDRTIYVLGKAPGLTTLTLLDATGRLITNVDVRVAPDISEFKQRLAQILPGERIDVRTANDGIVLSGTISSTAKLNRALSLAERYAPERVSNLMTVGGVQQVMLKVRFAEMQRSVAKELDASLAIGDVANRAGTAAFGTGRAALRGTYTSILGSGANGIPSTTTGDTAGSFNFQIDTGVIEIAVLLEALERKGVVRTLAEPNLTALSGQEASFLAGGEYPVPVAQTNNQITIEFKPFGVELSFIPTVIDGDLINLQMKSAVSSIDPTNGYTLANLTIDAFRRREATTTVELRDGESFAIAGLLLDDFTDINQQIPWLGDVPVLGALFRSASYQRDQSELVIIVTPHLVTPTRGDALVLPTDRIRPPSERELFLAGKVTGTNTPTTGAAGEVAKQEFSGSYGYVMD
ncbi:MAG: type II and III secretion system protein family protein [Marinovum sp.]|nr:type II and III secretion system protein family protein [Marinovum sp.]